MTMNSESLVVEEEFIVDVDCGEEPEEVSDVEEEVQELEVDMLLIWEKYQEFELCLYDEEDHKSRTKFITEWEERMCSALAMGCQYSDFVLAFKLLEKSALDFTQVSSILQNLVVGKEDANILVQTIDLIKKVCGETGSKTIKQEKKNSTGPGRGRPRLPANPKIISLDVDDAPFRHPKIEKFDEEKHIPDEMMSNAEEEGIMDLDTLGNVDNETEHEDVVQHEVTTDDQKPLQGINSELTKDVKENQCPICFKFMARKYDVKTHLSTHIRGKKFACSDCGAQFRHKKGVREHQLNKRCKVKRMASSPEPGEDPDNFAENVVTLITGNEEGEQSATYVLAENGTIIGGPKKKSKEKKKKKDFLYKIDVKSEANVAENQCPICLKFLVRKYDVKAHMEVHKELKEYTCETCGAMFRRLKNLAEHKAHNRCKRKLERIAARENLVKNYECAMCSERFVTKSQLKVHVRSHTGERPYKCQYCAESFAASVDLYKHHRSHPEAVLYSCKECKRDYVSIDTYFHHRVKQHGENEEDIDVEGDFQCGNCNMHFTSSAAYSSHRKLHGLVNALQCDVCGKTCPNKRSLKMHTLTHSEVKPFKCFICNKTFCQATGLKVHFRTHSGEKPYECEVCGRGFAIKKTMIVHMRTHTKERPYACEVCGKAFAHLQRYKLHARTHTGEKPHVCHICSKAFTRPEILKKHLKSHKPKQDELVKLETVFERPL